MVRRGFVAWLIGLALISYVLMSVAIAISTADDCDAVTDGKQHWVLVPPQWECGAGDIRLTPRDE
jgi:hypothetical protein